MDLIKNINQIKKTEKVDSLKVIRDYFIGIIASISNEVHSSRETGNIRKPIIIWGISIRKGHLPNFPRYTPDIDFESNIWFYERNWLSHLRNYELILEEIAQFVREKIVSIYGVGSDFEPKISKLRAPIDSLGNDFWTLKGNIIIPSFMGWENITIRNEVGTKRDTIVFPPIDLPIYHNFIDKDELALSDITVPQLSNILGNKIYSGLKRLANSVEESRISRIKDIFDIWFIDKSVPTQILDSELISIFNIRLKQENKQYRDQILKTMDAILINPEDFFREIFNIIASNVKSEKTSSDRDKMKRMTRWIIDSYDFPSVDDLISTFVKYLKIVGKD
jgi:hypothetical protein